MNSVEDWKKIDKRLQKFLKNHKYSFYEAVDILGCNERTLRRMMDDQLIEPVKVSDEWKFSEDIIHKARFILKCGKPLGIEKATVAGIYNYLIKHKIKPDIDEFRQIASEYWAEPIS